MHPLRLGTLSKVVKADRELLSQGIKTNKKRRANSSGDQNACARIVPKRAQLFENTNLSVQSIMGATEKR